MLQLASSHTRYARIGLSLFLLQFNVFAAALPPFHDGIWLQVEPVLLALYGGVVLNALWCLYGLKTGALKVTVASPLWMTLGAWLLWQCLTSLAAVNPWRSWLGSPELGEGVAFYFALALLMMMATPLWNVARYRQIILIGAAGAIALQCVLYVLCPLGADGRYVVGSWRPSTWAAYLAFMAGYLWIAFGLMPQRRTRMFSLVVIVGMILVLAVSHNASAMLLLGAAIAVSAFAMGIRMRCFRRFFYPSRAWRVVAMVACLLPLGWVGFSVAFPDIEPYTRAMPSLAFLSDKDGSLGSRISMNRMAVEALHHEPRLWLVGNGWGSFSDITFDYALISGLNVYSNGEWKPNSELVDGYSFHSHNEPLEALLSVGVVGLMLWLLIPIVAIGSIPRRCFWWCVPMLVGLVWVSNVWFELAQCLPFKALALAAIASVPRAKENTRHVPVRALSFGIICIALIAGWAGVQYRHFMRYEMQLRDAAHALPYDDYTQEWVEQDIQLGSSAEFFANWLMLKVKNQGLDDNDRGWYARFIEAAHHASQSPLVGGSVSALELKLYYKAMIGLEAPAFKPLQALMMANMPSVVLQLSSRVPQRDDIATPYLQHLSLFTAGQPQRQIEILNELLSIAPNHRGALWVLGGLLRHVSGREAEGLALQRKAAALHVEWVYPVTGAELAALKSMTEAP